MRGGGVIKVHGNAGKQLGRLLCLAVKSTLMETVISLPESI